ncbi:MAG: SMC family ATPase, partial [Clostridiales bacterium]|nr:SMC family ATPase [Clostridiales bacterium]
MRPLKLTMSAFGSYADVQEIDFAKLGASGLYLITGETGSGKTTIFDAVSFALFGRASGTGRDDYSMLRSDFAAEQARTYVELDFVSGGNRYSVRRSIRRAGQEAALRLPDGSTVGGDRAVRQKIAEIVGLDREQFAQIVMIAQNDFLRFLQSGTDERLKILRRIFGTEALRLFQERLKERARRESDRRELCVHSFERRGIDVYRRGEQFAEWEAQMAADGAELAGAEKRLGEYDEAKQALAAALAVAEELGRKLAALAACRAALAEHAARAGEIEGAKRRGARGAAALRNVKPLADEAAKAAASHGAAQAGLAAAKVREAAALAEREQAAKALGGLPPLAEAQAALAALAKEWEAASEKLKKLSRLRAGRDETAARQAALAAAQAELAAALRTLGGLPPLEGCQADAARLATELEAGAAALSRLAALRNDLGAIRSRQGGLAAAQAEFRAAAAAYDRASGEYEALNGIFLRNQAGVIASGLAAGAPCPVCGSTEHPAPAPPPEKGVTDAALKRAKDSWDRA